MRLLLVTALVAAVAAPAAQAGSSLVGTVGPGYTISLTSGGKRVTKLRPGTYRITVRDRSGDHDFHLQGPGVDEATEVVYRGTTRWTVKLKRGRYTFVCDPHQIIMKGSFRVG